MGHQVIPQRLRGRTEILPPPAAAWGLSEPGMTKPLLFNANRPS